MQHKRKERGTIKPDPISSIFLFYPHPEASQLENNSINNFVQKWYVDIVFDVKSVRIILVTVLQFCHHQHLPLNELPHSKAPKVAVELFIVMVTLSLRMFLLLTVR